MGMGGMMPNMGMLNMGMGGMMPNMDMTNMGMGGMMPNIGMFGMMPNMDINLQGMNFGGNPNWMEGYSTNINNNNNVDPSQRKVSCMFKHSTGQNPIMILMDYGKNVNNLVTIYFARIGQPGLINRPNDICLLYNAAKIPFNSTQKIEQFFAGNNNPQILVNDVNNLIGA